jgi:hypothetical protein
MAFYCYSNSSRELIEVSDFPLAPSDDQACSEVNGINKAELEFSYTWDTDSCSFVSTPKRIISRKDFLKKFTPQEYAGIKGATQQNAVVDYYWQLFMVAENIDLADLDVLGGLSALEQLGLLASGRAMEIVS